MQQQGVLMGILKLSARSAKPLALAMILNSIIVSLASITGAPGLAPITSEVLTVIIYSFGTCLLLNDFVKVLMVKKTRIRL